MHLEFVILTISIALGHRAEVPSGVWVSGVAPDPRVTAAGGVPAGVVVAHLSQAVAVGEGGGPSLAG